MNYGIPASDALAILLIQSDYNPDTTIKQAILNVEKYENLNNRYFGTYEGEFRMMFFWLAYRIEFCRLPATDYDYDEMSEFENITIRDWIDTILDFGYYESGGSDCLWLERRACPWLKDGKHTLLDKTNYEDSDFHVDYLREQLNSYELILKSVKLDYKIRQFFADSRNIDQKLIADFFKENLNMDILAAWSRSNFYLPSNEYNLPKLLESIISVLTPEKASNRLTMYFDGHYDKVILFLIDGLGKNQLLRFDQRNGCRNYIKENEIGGTLTCQFPSSTASNVTTIHTGLDVAEHGIYEWLYYEPLIDDIIAPVLFSYAKDDERETLQNKVNPEDIYPNETIYQKLSSYGVKSFVFQNEDYIDSTYSKSVLKGAEIKGYNSLREGLEILANYITNCDGKSYHLFYYDVIDKISHEHGPESEQFYLEVEKLFQMLEKFSLILNKYDKNVLFVLTSDHGHVSLDPNKNIYLNQEFPEIEKYIKRSGNGSLLVPAGSARDMFLYIKDEMLDDAQKFLQEKLYKKAVVYKTMDLIGNKQLNIRHGDMLYYFGKKGISKALKDRLGNLVILPVDNWTVWWYEDGVFEVKMKGHHGGLSCDEMEIPLLIWDYLD